MIPKMIHYCWFGGKPLDDKALKCIESWKKYFPDYEIIRWDESNFDIAQIDFMKQAYEDKKWAFVSDVARLIIIYNHGGIYFDTDVEVIKPYSDILREDAVGFFGLENGGLVASGLGYGCEEGHPFLQKHIDMYQDINYADYRDYLADIACPNITTALLEQNGFVRKNARQCILGLDIYPSEYFSPIDYRTGKLKKTKVTHSIHWYSASWQDDQNKNEQRRLRRFRRVFGKKLGDILHGITTCIRSEGIIRYIKKRVGKITRKES